MKNDLPHKMRIYYSLYNLNEIFTFGKFSFQILFNFNYLMSVFTIMNLLTIEYTTNNTIFDLPILKDIFYNLENQDLFILWTINTILILWLLNLFFYYQKITYNQDPFKIFPSYFLTLILKFVYMGGLIIFYYPINKLQCLFFRDHEICIFGILSSVLYVIILLIFTIFVILIIIFSNQEKYKEQNLLSRHHNFYLVFLILKKPIFFVLQKISNDQTYYIILNVFFIVISFIEFSQWKQLMFFNSEINILIGNVTLFNILFYIQTFLCLILFDGDQNVLFQGIQILLVSILTRNLIDRITKQQLFNKEQEVLYSDMLLSVINQQNEHQKTFYKINQLITVAKIKQHIFKCLNIECKCKQEYDLNQNFSIFFNQKFLTQISVDIFIKQCQTKKNNKLIIHMQKALFLQNNIPYSLSIYYNIQQKLNLEDFRSILFLIDIQKQCIEKKLDQKSNFNANQIYFFLSNFKNLKQQIYYYIQELVTYFNILQRKIIDINQIEYQNQKMMQIIEKYNTYYQKINDNSMVQKLHNTFVQNFDKNERKIKKVFLYDNQTKIFLSEFRQGDPISFLLISMKRERIGFIEQSTGNSEMVLGLKNQEVNGLHINCLIPKKYHDAHQQVLKNYLKTGQNKFSMTPKKIYILHQKENFTAVQVFMKVHLDINKKELFEYVLLKKLPNKDKQILINDNGVIDCYSIYFLNQVPKFNINIYNQQHFIYQLIPSTIKEILQTQINKQNEPYQNQPTMKLFSMMQLKYLQNNDQNLFLDIEQLIHNSNEKNYEFYQELQKIIIQEKKQCCFYYNIAFELEKIGNQKFFYYCITIKNIYDNSSLIELKSPYWKFIQAKVMLTMFFKYCFKKLKQEVKVNKTQQKQKKFSITLQCMKQNNYNIDNKYDFLQNQKKIKSVQNESIIFQILSRKKTPKLMKLYYLLFLIFILLIGLSLIFFYFDFVELWNYCFFYSQFNSVEMKLLIEILKFQNYTYLKQHNLQLFDDNNINNNLSQFNELISTVFTNQSEQISKYVFSNNKNAFISIENSFRNEQQIKISIFDFFISLYYNTIDQSNFEHKDREKTFLQININTIGKYFDFQNQQNITDKLIFQKFQLILIKQIIIFSIAILIFFLILYIQKKLFEYINDIYKLSMLTKVKKNFKKFIEDFIQENQLEFGNLNLNQINTDNKTINKIKNPKKLKFPWLKTVKLIIFFITMIMFFFTGQYIYQKHNIKELIEYSEDDKIKVQLFYQFYMLQCKVVFNNRDYQISSKDALKEYFKLFYQFKKKQSSEQQVKIQQNLNLFIQKNPIISNIYNGILKNNIQKLFSTTISEFLNLYKDFEDSFYYQQALKNNEKFTQFLLLLTYLLDLIIFNEQDAQDYLIHEFDEHVRKLCIILLLFTFIYSIFFIYVIKYLLEIRKRILDSYQVIKFLPSKVFRNNRKVRILLSHIIS